MKKTNVDIEYVSPFSFEYMSVEPPETPAEREVPDIPDVAQNDLGYFMSLAGRYELLRAEDEQRLGHLLWDGRRRILRILRAARSQRRANVSLELTPRARAITASSRRRMAKVEQYARGLVDRREPVAATTARGARAATAKLERALRDTVAEMDEARRELAESNLRLVVWVAKSFRGRGFDFIDLIQEGSVGLLRAIDRFDPMVGARFSTFATHWIQQGIRRALAEKARTIRIPVNRIPEVRQTLLARAQLAEELGRPARPEELAEAVGLPKHKLEELLPAIAPIESIDAPIASTERRLGDTLEDRELQTPLQCAMEEETRRAIAAVLHELPDRQRQILSMRHGIGYPRECTLEEIGDVMGLSRERIRQVEKVAVSSVKEWLRKNRPQLASPV